MSEMDVAADFGANIERFTGFAGDYDRFRPAPETKLADLLLQIAGNPSPFLIVDLGSGTGLATRFWGRYGKAVIGIEPNDEMRKLAEAQAGNNVYYRAGFAHATGLSNDCADMVTCNQALHWMEPESTFKEVHRLLKKGGLFAACDYDWPPVTGDWQVDEMYKHCMELGRRLEQEQGHADRLVRYSKDGHLGRMEASSLFAHTREIAIDQIDEGNAERLVGLLLSQGHTQALLKHGASEQDLEIDQLRRLADERLGPEMQRWYWTLRIRVGIK